MHGSRQLDTLNHAHTAKGLTPTVELVDESQESKLTKSKVLNKFLKSFNARIDEMERVESPIVQQYNMMKGEDRIYNKPMKVFTKKGNNIKRITIEKDANNIFSFLETNQTRNYFNKETPIKRSSS